MIKSGWELPAGTNVYFVKDGDICRTSLDTVRIEIKEEDYVFSAKEENRMISHLSDFILFNDDGLWATTYVRAMWRHSPHLHPHCTLFGILHKNLEI